VRVAPHVDDEGEEVTPDRVFDYDTLVLAIGSLSNDFGTPGVARHALKLESKSDAQRFHARMVNACIRAHAQTTPVRPEQLHVAIIGAGATGVELAAELHRTTREVVAYGLDRVDADKDIQVSVIEAADRILPALPPRLSHATMDLLRELGVAVHTNAKVAEVLPDGVRLADGRTLPAELVVWAAGVKAPDLLRDIAGLETNRSNQIVARATLQATRDDDIFAIGDCAACEWPQANGGKGGLVPPRAQAAHQQADYLRTTFLRLADGKGPQEKPYRYRDYGSLVSLGHTTSVGTLMGALRGASWFVEGFVARLMYVSLHLMHHQAVLGSVRTATLAVARFLIRRTTPLVKLH
jgi:NADH dehydrogenase